jgi:hypothetical protein
MDGSGLSLIVVPVVAVICLAAWLIMVFYAASHPQWGRARGAGAPAASRQPTGAWMRPGRRIRPGQNATVPQPRSAREPVAAPKARPAAASFQDEAHD